jgi:hypothetical protein
MSWFEKPGANTEAVVLKLKFGIEPICQSSHELKAKPSIGGRIEILRETDAIVSDLHHE